MPLYIGTMYLVFCIVGTQLRNGMKSQVGVILLKSTGTFKDYGDF